MTTTSKRFNWSAGEIEIVKAEKPVDKTDAQPSPSKRATGKRKGDNTTHQE